jgi:hypothetical protein
MGTKVIKSQPAADAGVVVAENVVRMNSNEDNGVMVDERGVTISGPVSFASGANHIRLGGLWTFNNPMTMMIPSTMATPGAVLMVDPPIGQLKNIMKDATVMIALLGGLSAIG